MSERRTVIITGGNTGLGFETARRAARDPSLLVLIACRSPDLGAEAVKRLEEDGCSASFLPLDLADQASIRRFVDLFRAANLPPLYAIICNAGMQNVAAPETTAEGYETTFAVNHLGHYLLVRALLHDVQRDGRITFVSSGTHDPKAKTKIPPPVYTNADTVAHDLVGGRSNGLRRYAMSKLCNLLCAYELQRLLLASHDDRLASIKVNALNPGMMPGTGLARTWPKAIQLIGRYVMPLIEKDVQTINGSAERLASLTLGDQASPGGRYFWKGAPIASSEDSYNEDFQRDLWVSSARMTGLPVDLETSYERLAI